jgi:hypothetical protein
MSSRRGEVGWSPVVAVVGPDVNFGTLNPTTGAPEIGQSQGLAIAICSLCCGYRN